MSHSRPFPVLLGSLAVTLATAFTIFFVFGSLRYGGPDGLLFRVRSEVAERRPHPQFVPTPLLPAVQIAYAAPAVAQSLPGDGGLGQSQSGSAALPQALSQPAPILPAVRSPLTPTATVPVVTPRPAALPVQLAPSATLTVAPAAATYAPVAAQVELTGAVHYWQSWNNCGPATLAANLSFHGSKLTQADVASTLRPNRDDKNVNPEEMVAYARAQGYEAVLRVNGTADRMRLLLSNGIPVLIETWLEPAPNDGMGHYRLLVGYDDTTRLWRLYDSYVSAGVDPKQPYRGILIPYAELEKLWAVFNHTYIVIYSGKQAALVSAILGPDLDEKSTWQRALAQQQALVARAPTDAFAHFNLGSDLVAHGRYSEAAAVYDQARRIGLPWRMLWYQFGPFRAYIESGRYEEAIALADATLASSANSVEELYYWKGMALKARGDLAGARQNFDRAVKLNPNYAAAIEALKLTGG